MKLCKGGELKSTCGRMPTLKCVRPDECSSSLDMIPLSTFERATTLPHARVSINSTHATKLPYAVEDRASTIEPPLLLPQYY